MVIDMRTNGTMVKVDDAWINLASIEAIVPDEGSTSFFRIYLSSGFFITVSKATRDEMFETIRNHVSKRSTS